MENTDSSVLSPTQLKTPLQKILVDKNDVGYEKEQYIRDDSDIETKMEEQEKNSGSSELEELSLVCEEDELMRCKEHPDLSVSHSRLSTLSIKHLNLVCLKAKQEVEKSE